jgi:acylphosphatase
VTLLQVTGEAQGAEDMLKKFIQIINKGPPLAKVSEVEHTDVENKDGEKGFQQFR